MLMNLIEQSGDSVVWVDPFTGSEEYTERQTNRLFDRFSANVKATGKESQVRVTRSPSSEALPRLAAEGFRCDFAYVDGSHRAADVLMDLCATWPLLNPGGALHLRRFSLAAE